MTQLDASTKDPWVGRTFKDGAYTLERLLGTGASGRVYLGHHVAMAQKVAIKILHSSYQNDADLTARFRQEGEAAQRIRHVNVVNVLDFGQEPDGALYLVSEYLSGHNLDTLMSHGGVPRPLRCLGIMTQILDAVHAAHQNGVIHRDLKPKNVFIRTTRSPDGRVQDRVKILNFGIASVHDADTDRRISTEIVAGAPAYMSPEQCRGEAADARSDIYACGCLLFLMLTGKQAFSGATPIEVIRKQVDELPRRPSELRDGLKAEFDAVVLRALQKAPRRRYQTAEAFQADLRALLTATALPEATLSSLEPASGQPSRQASGQPSKQASDQPFKQPEASPEETVQMSVRARKDTLPIGRQTPLAAKVLVALLFVLALCTAAWFAWEIWLGGQQTS